MKDLAKKTKNKKDLLKYFEHYQVEEANRKVDLINRQNELYLSFLKDYPEFSKLNRSDIEKLLTKVIKNAQMIVDPVTVLFYNNTRNKIMWADETQRWAKAVERCNIGYGLALVSIWTDVAIASAFSVGFAAAPAIASALAATGVAYLAKEFCIEWVTDEYLDIVS